MKKVIFTIVFISCIICFCALNINIAKTNNMNDLSLKDIEALADEANQTAPVVYCCSPYTKVCVWGGPGQSNVMGSLKYTPCS